MKLKILFFILLLISISACATNDNTIVMPNRVRTITFHGDDVTLTYSNNDTISADMDSITIVLEIATEAKNHKGIARISRP